MDKVVDLGDKYAFRRNVDKQRVAVVGAGPAGLAGVRHAVEAGLDTVCFEQTDHVGGTWVYTPRVGKDEFGVPVHSTLYKNLQTNLPKEVMNYPDFPFKEMDKSYISCEEVLQYLQDYAAKFELNKYIKLRHKVTSIKPLVNCWSLSVLDVVSKLEQPYVFDAIIVCSGPNIIPVYPKIELAKFSGHQLHSKEYKEPGVFANQKVLVIGLGPSGLDICLALVGIASKVIISHNHMTLLTTVSEDVIVKPTVDSIEDKVVYFSDGSSETVDTIIHCTGYTYNYSFLDRECGVVVDQYVFPLYKHFISIQKPTLCFIGLPKYCSHLYMVDYQVRTFIKSLTGEIKLPSKETMMNDFEDDIRLRESDGQRKKDFHKLGKERTKQYFKDLATLGELEEIPPVQLSLFNAAFLRAVRDFSSFRKVVYKIIDNENYEIVSE